MNNAFVARLISSFPFPVETITLLFEGAKGLCLISIFHQVRQNPALPKSPSSHCSSNQGPFKSHQASRIAQPLSLTSFTDKQSSPSSRSLGDTGEDTNQIQVINWWRVPFRSVCRSFSTITVVGKAYCAARKSLDCVHIQRVEGRHFLAFKPLVLLCTYVCQLLHKHPVSLILSFSGLAA